MLSAILATVKLQEGTKWLGGCRASGKTWNSREDLEWPVECQAGLEPSDSASAGRTRRGSQWKTGLGCGQANRPSSKCRESWFGTTPESSCPNEPARRPVGGRPPICPGGFDLDLGASFFLPPHSRCRRFLQQLLDKVAGHDGLVSGDDMKVRQAAETHHSPHHNLQRLFYGLSDGYVRALVRPDAIVLPVGRMVQLRRRLVREQGSPPVPDCPVADCP